MSSMKSRTSRSACDQATASSIRTVPPTTPAEGMTLGATPARTIPHTTLTPARGSRRRDSTAGSSVISLPRAKVRSSVRCGREVWPPLPVSRTSSWSAAPVIGPSRTPTWPRSRVGSQWRQKIRSTSSRAPSSSMDVAPPGMTSSAGWNSSRTRPGSSPRRCTSASASPAPTRPAVCTSWPQACATPGRVLTQASVVRSSTGRASRSARSATARPRWSPMSTTRPVCGSRVTVEAGALEARGDDLGGALLVPGELGVGVQVAAQLEELCPVRLDRGVDQVVRSS